MEAYTGFAAVYDTLMDNVPYGEWSRYLIGLLREYGIDKGLVCELGCGTGSITRRLRDAGYDMIGIDLSENMLDIAREYEFAAMEEAGMETMAPAPMAEEKIDTEPMVSAFMAAGEADLIGQEEMKWEKEIEQRKEIEEQKEYERQKETNPSDILYLNQDMREFELYGTVAAVVSICDSMNYITEEADLEKVFRLVNNYLDPGGIFIFDMNTIHKYRDQIGDTTIAENREDCSLIWENAYEEETGLNRYDITIFKRVEFEDEDAEELYERIRETHFQRAYAPETIVHLLTKAGLEFVAMYEACTHEPVKEGTERMYFIAREKHQEGKLYI